MKTASTCRPDNPLPCAGRVRARLSGPGVWFSYEARTWMSATPEGILAVTHCPYCGGPLPTMAESILRALADPDDEC